MSGSFSSLYHLHTPKTGGHWVDSLIIKQVYPSLKEAGFEYLADHAGWSHVFDDTYVVSAWRDPVNRTVSHFCHYKKFFTLDDSAPSEKELLIWVQANETGLSNYQSKSLFYQTEKHQVPYFYLNHDEFLSTKVDHKSLWGKLSRINILIKDVDMNEEVANQATQQIASDLGLNYVPHDYEDINFNINDHSKTLRDSLSDGAVDYLYKINPIDTEVYAHDNSDYWFTRKR